MALFQDKDYDVAMNYDFKTFDPQDNAPDSISTEERRVDVKAKSLVKLNAGDSVLRQLVSEETSRAYWIKLHALYQGK